MPFDFVELTNQLERAYSRRIALRPASISDAWPLFQATRNPLFNRYLLWPRPDTEEQVLRRLHLIVDAARQGRITAVSATVRQTGEFIGLFRFLPHATRKDTVEMGIWIHDRFWHGRYSLEIGRLCVSAAFSLSDVQMLLGASAPENRGSCGLMRAVGMVEGALVTRDTEMGHGLLLQEFTISREEWRHGHATAFDYYEPQAPRLPVFPDDADDPEAHRDLSEEPA